MHSTPHAGWSLRLKSILLALAATVASTRGGQASETPAAPPGDVAAAPADPESPPAHESGGNRGDYLGDPINAGFLFVDGTYLAPPYVVSRQGDEILINAVVVERARPQDSASSEHHGNRRSGSRGRPRFRYSVLEIEELLADDGAVIAFDGVPAIAIAQQLAVEFLNSLVLTQDRNERRYEMAGLAADDVDSETWDEFIRSFSPSADLVARVEALKTRDDHTEASNIAQIAAVRRSEFLLYPLTLVGMVISVLSLGNLLLSRPPAVLSWREVDASQQVTRMVVQCTLFVVALSLLDLVYTVLALQTSQMREMNPLGTHFIHDPVLLAVFKGLATLVGVSILVALRRYRGAQMASWWLCLICTVVTFRWLTFNSMFIS